MFNAIDPDHSTFAESEGSRATFMFKIVNSEVLDVVEVLLFSVG